MSDNNKVHPMFFGASQKFLWASMKLNDLADIVENYNELCVRMRFIPARSFEECGTLLVEAHDIPFPRAPFIGDILRNLRGSLDHATSAMLRAVEERDDNNYFPIDETSKNFLDRVEKFLKKTKSEKLTDFFVNKVDSTKDGLSKDIWYLNQIDRANKHRQLVVVEEVVVAPMPDMASDTVLFHECFFKLKPGYIAKRQFPSSVNMIETRPRPGSLKISFGPNEILPGEDVLKVLNRFREKVFDILKGLQDEYLREYPDRANMEALRLAQHEVATTP